MARMQKIVLISVVVCCALFLIAFMPQTMVESPTGYFSMQVKENPGMKISVYNFSPEEYEMVNARIRGDG